MKRFFFNVLLSLSPNWDVIRKTEYLCEKTFERLFSVAKLSET